jgi:hypothetical protein
MIFSPYKAGLEVQSRSCISLAARSLAKNVILAMCTSDISTEGRSGYQNSAKYEKVLTYAIAEAIRKDFTTFKAGVNVCIC